MDINDLGYGIFRTRISHEPVAEDFSIGRIVSEQKDRYRVFSGEGEYDAEITGTMRYSARDRLDFPSVGDWVAVSLQDDGFALIFSVFPRYSILKRRAVDHYGESQVIATNIDAALILQAAGRDFNLNRVERYLTICNEAGIAAILVVTKIDLLTEAEIGELWDSVVGRIGKVPLLMLSNETKQGYGELNVLLEKGKTYCLLGSSGVGKSTLLNGLSGTLVMKTGGLSETNSKGRHTTSHRELAVLRNGAIIIDNPGMREVGIGDGRAGLEVTYDRIRMLARDCKFRDCRHVNEKGCAVLEALEKKEIDASVYENYLKLENESRHFLATAAEKRKKDKDFGKLLKNYHDDRKKEKF